MRIKFSLDDCDIKTMRGSGPGGQHRNKTDSACKVTHRPTGISAYADERSQHHSKRKAIDTLKGRLLEVAKERAAADKKAHRDHVIHNCETIRTYDFKAGVVRDHRTGKVASLKNVLGKGRIELLAEDA